MCMRWQPRVSKQNSVPDHHSNGEDNDGYEKYTLNTNLCHKCTRSRTRSPCIICQECIRLQSTPSSCIGICLDSNRFATSRRKMTGPKDSRCSSSAPRTRSSDGSIIHSSISCRILLQKICYRKNIYRGPWVANL